MISVVVLNEGDENSVAKDIEMIKTRSGEWYSLSLKDNAIFVKETTQILQKYIVRGNLVGLFLDLDNAQFSSMILYQACIACGVSIIRCGISDFERQLPVNNDIVLDYLICTKTAQKHIMNKINYNECIVVDYIENIEGQLPSCDELKIYELFNIPGFIISDSRTLFCPGYTIYERNGSEKTIYIESSKEIEGFKVSDYYLNLSLSPSNAAEQAIHPVHSYIKLQIRIMLKEVLNGKVDCRESISLNSIGMVELLVKLEEEFCISIPIEKINKSVFENLHLLSNLIYSTIMEKE